MGSRHSNSNCIYHIVILWSLCKVLIESLHNNSHQRETIYDKLIFFAKLVKQWKSKEWAKFELECELPIFIYFNNQNLKSLIKTWTLNASTSGKILKLKGHLEYIGIYFSWWNHQMHFKMFDFNMKLVNLKCVMYAQVTHSSVLRGQPHILSIMFIRK